MHRFPVPEPGCRVFVCLRHANLNRKLTPGLRCFYFKQKFALSSSSQQCQIDIFLCNQSSANTLSSRSSFGHLSHGAKKHDDGFFLCSSNHGDPAGSPEKSSPSWVRNCDGCCSNSSLLFLPSPSAALWLSTDQTQSSLLPRRIFPPRS